MSVHAIPTTGQRIRKRIYLAARDRLGPRSRRWAEVIRASWGLIRSGFAGFNRDCNICGYSGPFYPHGIPHGLTLQLDTGCPSCVSLGRHRLIKIWCDDNLHLISGRRILHFAPEGAVCRFIEPLSSSYQWGDLNPERGGGLVLNIESIDVPDECFDIVICSHIIEHVDDGKALRELHRILSPGGLALLMTPVIDAWTTTYENPSIDNDRERLLHFGQADHLRYYGADVRDRISAAGFEVTTFVAVEPCVAKHGLTRGETLYIGKKPAMSD